MHSSNNTILETDSNQVCLTFAKTQENIYMINAMNPLSLLQVCFFGVSNIDKQVFSYWLVDIFYLFLYFFWLNFVGIDSWLFRSDSL